MVSSCFSDFLQVQEGFTHQGVLYFIIIGFLISRVCLFIKDCIYLRESARAHKLEEGQKEKPTSC